MHNLFTLIKSTVEVLIRRVQNSYCRLLNCVTFYFFLVLCGRTCFLLWKMAKSWNSFHAAHIFNVLHFSSSVRKQSAVYIWYICRIRHDVKEPRVSRTQCCKRLGLQSIMQLQHSLPERQLRHQSSFVWVEQSDKRSEARRLCSRCGSGVRDKI